MMLGFLPSITVSRLVPGFGGLQVRVCRAPSPPMPAAMLPFLPFFPGDPPAQPTSLHPSPIHWSSTMPQMHAPPLCQHPLLGQGCLTTKQSSRLEHKGRESGDPSTAKFLMGWDCSLPPVRHWSTSAALLCSEIGPQNGRESGNPSPGGGFLLLQPGHVTQCGWSHQGLWPPSAGHPHTASLPGILLLHLAVKPNRARPLSPLMFLQQLKYRGTWPADQPELFKS